MKFGNFGNQTEMWAVIERTDDSTVYIAGPATMVDTVYNQVDQMCVGIRANIRTHKKHNGAQGHRQGRLQKS